MFLKIDPDNWKTTSIKKPNEIQTYYVFYNNFIAKLSQLVLNIFSLWKRDQRCFPLTFPFKKAQENTCQNKKIRNHFCISFLHVLLLDSPSWGTVNVQRLVFKRLKVICMNILRLLLDRQFQDFGKAPSKSTTKEMSSNKSALSFVT